MLADAAAVILAGGRGRRLGGAVKPLLEVEGRTILDRQLEVLRPLVAEVWISANDPEPLRRAAVPIVADCFPGAGPLAGIHAALGVARAPWLLAVAGDLPFLSAAVIEVLAAQRADSDVVLPRVGGYLEPLFGFYHRRCAPLIGDRLAAGRRKAQDLAAAAELRVALVDEAALRAVDPELHSFVNVNSPKDLP